jgi:hypothetical protein
MRKLFVICLGLFLYGFVHGQDSAKAGNKTFHIKPPLDRKNGTWFKAECQEKGLFRGIFVDKNGSAYFYWDSITDPDKLPVTMEAGINGMVSGWDGWMTDSVAIASDTDVVNKIESIITPAYISKLQSSCSGWPDTECAYYIEIIVNGRVDINFTALDIDYLAKCKAINEVQPLIKALDKMYKKYGPK